MTSIEQHKTLALEGPLTVPHAESICARVLDALDTAQSVTIDVSGATGIDISFLQILIAANKSAARDRKTMTLSAQGYEMVESEAVRCGLRGHKDDNAAQALPSVEARKHP